MLMFDVSHRLMRTDSALDFLCELYKSHNDQFQDAATKQLVGCVVLTRYNNRTYRIDDIAWDNNPLSTFLDHTGQSVTFTDYYKRAYGKVIRDTEQPLLIHRPRRRDRLNKEAPEEVICLVPELCYMTGLTDYARSDFSDEGSPEELGDRGDQEGPLQGHGVPQHDEEGHALHGDRDQRCSGDRDPQRPHRDVPAGNPATDRPSPATGGGRLPDLTGRPLLHHQETVLRGEASALTGESCGQWTYP